MNIILSSQDKNYCNLNSIIRALFFAPFYVAPKHVVFLQISTIYMINRVELANFLIAFNPLILNHVE